MSKMSYAGCPGQFPGISAQFTLKMCVAAAKITKKPYFEGLKVIQGHRR